VLPYVPGVLDAWAAFTFYGNVAGDWARVPTMLLAMLGLAVMVAAVDGVRDTHRAFVIAYVALRWSAGAIYGRGEVVVDWPLAQYGAGGALWTARRGVRHRCCGR
jgi:hypothetical protein